MRSANASTRSNGRARSCASAGEKYSPVEFTNQVAGRITVRPEGFGFVLVPDGPDLFIPRNGMHGAMDGDTVLAREERSARARPGGAERISGSVVKVLDRARERVVGRFEKQEGRPDRSALRPAHRRRHPHRRRKDGRRPATGRSSRFG